MQLLSEQQALDSTVRTNIDLSLLGRLPEASTNPALLTLLWLHHFLADYVRAYVCVVW